ncbi:MULTISPECIES: LeuA family protein [unclassified Haladaptatus]|uniref:LeuA family protein n=1 Tax=unclassified Haladaptatus TaxID=2622732 RepID=UPI0023E898EC|nr:MULTISPECIES: citramalate synthase [unclassified Haladaptatus]
MKLLDVTLREGEQRPGRRFSVDQKVEAASHLDALGVDYIQLGFPVADDRTRRVCEQYDGDAKTTGIARAIQSDIDAAVEAGVDVIDLFAPTSDAQREFMLGTSREELLETVHDALDAAHDTGLEVHFTAMDGFRTELAFLNEVVEQVEAAFVTIADTVGSRTPKGVTETLTALDADLSGVGVHFHDDIGVATANALTAADMGVGRVDVSVAGIGERAGNVPLEEFVVAGLLGEEAVDSKIDESDLLTHSRAVLAALGEDVSAWKPLLGDQVFAHESGLHTAAMLDDPALFEPFDPARFGGERRLLFGPDTGRGAARRLFERAGIEPTDERVATLLDALANREEVDLNEALSLARRVK